MFGDEGEKLEESESSEGWLQGPAGSYVYQGCSHLGAPMGGFSGSGQCPPVTLNHPAVQSGPRQVRMRPQDAPLTSQRAPPSQLPTLRSSPPLLIPRPDLSRTHIHVHITYTSIIPAYGPARLGVLISSTVPDTLFLVVSLRLYFVYLTSFSIFLCVSPFVSSAPTVFCSILFLFIHRSRFFAKVPAYLFVSPPVFHPISCLYVDVLVRRNENRCFSTSSHLHTSLPFCFVAYNRNGGRSLFLVIELRVEFRTGCSEVG